jgi:hypothetical protein
MKVTVNQIDDGDPMAFSVVVESRGHERRHRVTMARARYQELTGGKVDPPTCIRAAFNFLLERESPDEILASFDINAIQLYFPNFPRDFPDYLR